MTTFEFLSHPLVRREGEVTDIFIVRAECVHQRYEVAIILGIIISLSLFFSASANQNPLRGYRRILNFCMGSQVTKIGRFQ